MQRTLTQRRDELVHGVEENRREMQKALVELGAELGRTFSLREQLGRRPTPWLIGSFCIGLLLGARR